MSENESSSCGCTVLGLLVATAASAGSLWASLGMDLVPCPLCFYQRAFALGAFGVLAIGLLAGVRPSATLSLVALPLAVAGLGVAGWHVSLELSGKMECPIGLFGLGTVPQQSLAAFVLLTLVLGGDMARSCCKTGGPRYREVAGLAVLFGALFALGCIKATKPLPVPDELTAQSLPKEIKICRKPAPPS